MGVLKGPRTKLARAQSQAKALNAELDAGFQSETNTIAAEYGGRKYYDSSGRVIWEIIVKVGELPLSSLSDDFGLRLGECLHNFRGALDHTIWQLVHSRVGRLKAHEQRRIEFPMKASREAFCRDVTKHLPGLEGSLITLIEGYQPYRRTESSRFIRFLKTLTNTDKHRTLLVTSNYTGSAQMELSWTGGRLVEDRMTYRAGTQIKRGTELGTLILSCSPLEEPTVTVNGTIRGAAAFPPSILPPYAGRIPIATRLAINGIDATCEQIVGEIEAHL